MQIGEETPREFVFPLCDGQSTDDICVTLALHYSNFRLCGGMSRKTMLFLLFLRAIMILWFSFDKCLYDFVIFIRQVPEIVLTSPKRAQL